MITYVQGDLFESPAQVLVNTVNTVGVMGKGVALTFKRIWPEMYQEYRGLCDRGELHIGTLHLFTTANKLILNFPTKKHWRQPSRPEYIEAGLRTFVDNYERMRIRSIAFPPLGCGNGELDFETQVRPLMERYLTGLPIAVYIYAPRARQELPEHKNIAEIAAWLRSTPAELPFGEVWADIVERFRVRRRLVTLTGRGSFDAQFVASEDGMRFWPAGRTEFASKDEFLALWTQLRTFGFLTTRGTPNRERIASYTFPVLAELDYVKAVNLGDSYESYYYSPSMALQLIPPSDELPQQRELLSHVAD